MKPRDFLIDALLGTLIGSMLVEAVIDGNAAIAGGAGITFGLLVAAVLARWALR